jgi:hypothetical protein
VTRSRPLVALVGEVRSHCSGLQKHQAKLLASTRPFQPLAFKQAFAYRTLHSEVAVAGVYLRVYRHSLRTAAEQCTAPPSRFAHELLRVAITCLEAAVRSHW